MSKDNSIGKIILAVIIITVGILAFILLDHNCRIPHGPVVSGEELRSTLVDENTVLYDIGDGTAMGSFSKESLIRINAGWKSLKFYPGTPNPDLVYLPADTFELLDDANALIPGTPWTDGIYLIDQDGSRKFYYPVLNDDWYEWQDYIEAEYTKILHKHRGW